jgi:hypothetical protein
MTCEPEIWNVLFVPGTSFPDLLVVITLHRGPITIKPVRAATGNQVTEKVDRQNWFNKPLASSSPPTSRRFLAQRSLDSLVSGKHISERSPIIIERRVRLVLKDAILA